MRIVSAGHAAFAVALVALGVLGFATSDFSPMWSPVSKSFPLREALIYVCAIVSLVCGAGIAIAKTANVASRVLLAYLAFWLLAIRVPQIVKAPLQQDPWSGLGETAVFAAAAWVLLVWFAGEWDSRHIGFAVGPPGLRLARTTYGLAMIPFGIAHFFYAKETASLVPGWLPWHLFWAYFFGVTFLIAGAAILSGFFARAAAALSAAQIAIFTIFVWLPAMVTGPRTPFAISETIDSIILTIAAALVAESYALRHPERSAEGAQSKGATR